jgi:hypothetical protein
VTARTDRPRAVGYNAGMHVHELTATFEAALTTPAAAPPAPSC